MILSMMNFFRKHAVNIFGPPVLKMLWLYPHALLKCFAMPVKEEMVTGKDNTELGQLASASKGRRGEMEIKWENWVADLVTQGEKACKTYCTTIESKTWSAILSTVMCKWDSVSCLTRNSLIFNYFKNVSPSSMIYNQANFPLNDLTH